MRKTSRHENLGDIESALKAEIEKEDQAIEALRAKAEERRRRQEEDARREEAEKARLESEKRVREVKQSELDFKQSFIYFSFTHFLVLNSQIIKKIFFWVEVKKNK